MAAAPPGGAHDLAVPNERLPALLKSMGVGDERATDATRQRRLLTMALHTCQRLQKALAFSSSESQQQQQQQQHQHQQTKLLDPRELKTRDWKKAFGSKADSDMFTMQELLILRSGAMEDSEASPWLNVRRTIVSLLSELPSGQPGLRVEAVRGKVGVAIEVLGARVAPDGKTPLLELRYWRSKGDGRSLEWPEHAYGFPRTNSDSRADEVLLLTALLEANASVLAPAYVSAREGAWGAVAGLQGARASLLLPIHPLDRDVKLPRSCQVCDKDGASACSACHQVYYCCRGHQKEDWPRHKADCKRAQQEREQQQQAAAAAMAGNGGAATAAGSAASGAAAGAGAGPAAAAAAAAAANTVVVKLQEELGGPLAGQYATVIPFNQGQRGMQRAARPDNFMHGTQPAPRREPGPKKFIVKIQAPMMGGSGPLMLYDEGRRVFAYVDASQQPAGTHAALLRTVRARGFMGAKAYFWATLESGTQLLVQTDPIPGQTHSW